MGSYQFIQWSSACTGLAFFIAFGCVVGSFINVIAYRLPKGLSITTPPSACPACATRLTWRENFPVLGWLWLRGRCRFCKSPISAQYPIIEACVGLLFGALYALWFMQPSIITLVGLQPRIWRPDFADEGLFRTWPHMMVILTLLGALVASTLIDAKTFTIPLAIPWFATGVGLLAHPLHAAWIGMRGGQRLSEFAWTIPVPTGASLGAALGGAVGLAGAIVLLRRGVLPLSFADYDAWEKAHAALDPPASPEPAPDPGSTSEPEREPVSRVFLRAMFLTGPALGLMFVGFSLGLAHDLPLRGMALGGVVGLLLGVVLRRLIPGPAHAASAEPIWTAYPHARREMLKELLFLAPCVALALAGAWLAGVDGPLGAWAGGAPLWLRALGGSLLGYMVGGGIVWLFRIAGTLVLGKEAMGLGDVHLLAAAGAVLGWIDPLLAFFTAPFLGLTWAALSVFFSRVFHRQGTALPYGPHLATATVLVLLGKPLFEMALAALLRQPVNIP